MPTHPRALGAGLLLFTLLIPIRSHAEMPSPGTVVTADNMEQYAEVLTPTLEYFLRNGMEIPVVEYRRYDWPPAYKAATEKYSGQVSLSDDGRDMVNYVAGAPFPTIDPADPNAGTKWMWNHEQKTTYSDNVGCGWNMRKVRRLSMANCSDAFWGTDIDAVWVWNSKLPFWTFKYLGEKKLLTTWHSGGYAQREAWCAQPDGQSGINSFIWCIPHELRDTVIIEGVPTGFNQYAYSKRMVYIDKESSMALTSESYDHGGQLWRAWHQAADVGRVPNEIVKADDGSLTLRRSQTTDLEEYEWEQIYSTHGTIVDFQLDHTSKWDFPDAFLYPDVGIKHWYFNKKKEWNNPDTFTINYLIKSAGF